MLDKGTLIKNRIRKAKDITKVFKNLENKGYTLNTYDTKVFSENYFKTDITFSNVDINVVWRPHTEKETSNGYKQEVFLITY